jgi:glycosyltransferase involved in cell wall biosynthesis
MRRTHKQGLANMRLAFIGGFAFSPKGTIRARAHPLAAELARAGHEVRIFLPPYDNIRDSGREWIEDGVRITNSTLSNSCLTYPRGLAALIRAVSRYQPDLIHVFKPKGFAGAAGTYFLVKSKSKVVLDCDDWEGWGGWNEVQNYSWILKEYIDRQERWMMRSAPAVTVASRWLQQRAAQLRGAESSVFYVPNCARVGEAHESACSEARKVSPSDCRRLLNLPDGPLILYSGHFERGEEIESFCRVAIPIANRSGAAFVFIGKGPELSKVQEQFPDSSPVRAFFFPQLPYPEFIKVVRASTLAVYLYPNDVRHRSKCSVRIIDYMMMGKPVITSAVGQNLEYIVDGESGILIPPGDGHSFAEKLDYLLHSPEQCARIGENAARRISYNFIWRGEALQQCLAAYERVTNT